MSVVPELVVLFSADSDIQAAFAASESLQPGRGELLLRHLDMVFGQLLRFPEMAPVFHGTYRKMLVPGFPYGVFYSIEGRRVIVSGVMNLRQDPSTLNRRLSSDMD